MNTAVLVSGQMRSLDGCIASIQKHILDRIGDYDVIAHVADDEDAWKVELLEPAQCVVVRQPEFDEKNYVHRSGRGVIGIQPVLRMFWSMEEANRLRQEREAALGLRYDWVIRLRPDTQFYSDIEDLAACDPAAVHVPTFSNYYGYQDRFAFGGPGPMDAYHDKLGRLDAYVEGGGIFHPESMLKWMLDRAGVPVRRTAIVFDTLRKNGLRKRPVWEERFGDVVPDWKKAFGAA